MCQLKQNKTHLSRCVFCLRLQLICKSQFAKTQEHMSPFLTCFPLLPTAEPYGQGNTRLSHIKRRRLIMPLVALVQKKQSAPATAYKFWCSALPSSSPLLLAFRLRRSECLPENAFSRSSSIYCVFRRVQGKVKCKHTSIKTKQNAPSWVRFFVVS